VTNFRALGSSVPLLPRYLPGAFHLGANPPTIIDKTDGMQPRVAGEPALAAALAPLSADEISQVQSWGSPEKVQFLAAYQYIAVMSAAGLRRPDGTPFDGLLTQGIAVALAALQAAQAYFKVMPTSLAQAADQMASVLKDASTNTDPQSIDATKKYLLLRDRVAWELATQNDLTLEYEIVGTDAANPGVIYTRRIGEDRSPDYSAVFSTRTPAQLFQDGLDLESKFESLGVPFKKLDMSGANRRLGVGAAPMLAILITIIVGALSFYWLWNHTNQQNHLTQTAVNLVTSDNTLSNSDKAAKVAAINAGNNFFSQFFGATVPWTEILVVLGLGVLAALAYPFIISETRRSGFLSRVHA
jgi:hypothetical protein